MMALAASCVTALGINCRGSVICDSFTNTNNPDLSAAESLRREITAHVSDSRWYQNGQKIVCIDQGGGGQKFGGAFRHSLCAFLKRTGGYPGNEIKVLAQRIVEHGCKTCGSVPVFFDQGDNDLNSHGELTFDYVARNTNGDGMCRSISGTCYYE
jgi:hypothetical protein